MFGSETLRDLRISAGDELHRLRAFDWRAFAVGLADGAVRGIMAGLSAKELRAILRGDAPTERPNPRYKAQVKSFVLHIRPKYYQRASTWFTHTWRLGWFSVFFFIVETVTGIILMVFYAPTPERAYGDMLNLLGHVPFGKFMRDLHRLGAEGMVAVVVLHMLRVYLTGSYKGPRKFTWFTGAILLLVTLVLSFSGYLLPWDQLAYWAVTIGTSMAEAAPLFGMQVNLLLRGAVDIWAGGLLRFYLLHIFLLPLVAVIFISVHYYKVAREHSISLPARIDEGDVEPDEKRKAEERIDLLPNLLIHEMMLASVALLAMVAMVATFYSAPLETHADPQITPLHTKAPWYFLWLQGMLKLGSKNLFGVVLPTVIFAIIFAVPWLDKNPHRLPSRRKGGLATGLMFAGMIVLLTYMGTPSYGIETPPAQNILSELVPATEPGPVRELPWDLVEAGPDGSRRTYLVSYDERLKSDPLYEDAVFLDTISLDAENEWYDILDELKAEVESEAKLIPPVHGDAPLAMVTVENLQPELKWIVFTITWDELVISTESGAPTEALHVETVVQDSRSGEAARDEDGRLRTEDEVVVVYDPQASPYVILSEDGCPEQVLKKCVVKRFFEEGKVEWKATVAQGSRAVERTLVLDLADAVPNLKRSIQVTRVALHRDSHYHD